MNGKLILDKTLQGLKLVSGKLSYAPLLLRHSDPSTVRQSHYPFLCAS